MKQINIEYHKTPFGEFIIGSFENKLCLLDFRYRKNRETIDNRLKSNLKAVYVEQTSEIIKECKKQLDEYFNKERKNFDIPLLLVGSDFQKNVWDALIKIPYGKTSSYLELAKNIDNEKAVRAVANANGANCIAIIIPCHRVIGSDGSLTGYAGGLATKKKLLELENNLFN
ncbi:MAG: methylated-DNA--[protein]-cysteine S-methyltransferase [Thiovulaceae bacterium]|nr:methylated-DNA--[protein]-cysteine S-methyltransferase [Sulfurimonadaceae bacterium]